MQTTTAENRTGEQACLVGTKAMEEAVQQLSPPSIIDTALADQLRETCAIEAEPLGSIPAPRDARGLPKQGLEKRKGNDPETFVDKMGERIAFERGGVRLYDALMVKYLAMVEKGILLPNAAECLQSMKEESAGIDADETALSTMQRIRSEELAHFQMLCEAVKEMGADPSAQTPCADATAVAAFGLAQVVSDARTTLAQALNAMLTAELTDNAGWELLIQLAEQSGKKKLAERFRLALGEEAEHLRIVRAWHCALVTMADGV